MNTAAPPVRSAVVIGAGLSGLSAALHLRGRGVEVTVVEREAVVGGRAPLVELTGSAGTYRLDTGPTVLTEIPTLARCFAAVGEDVRDRLQLTRLDPAYEARFADGSALRMRSGHEAMHDEVAAFAGARPAAGWDRLATRLSRLYDTEMPAFIGRNLDGPLDLLRPELARLVRLGGFRRLDRLVASFLDDPRLQRAFSFQALYAGVAPSRALGLFAVIGAMDLLHGVYHPAGGMAAVARAMADAARAHGVQIATDEPVEHVVPGPRAHRVETGARTLTADAVVITAEPARAMALLGRAVPPTRPSPSCVVLAAGLRRRLPAGAHHTVCFGRAWQEVFDDLEEGRPMRDPSFLVGVPTRTDPTLAPPGGEVLFALFPAPPLKGGPGDLDWDRLAPAYRDHVLDHLARAGFGPLDIDVQTLITPADWSRRGLPHGTPFSAAHTFGQSGPFRHPNTVAPRVALAGSGTTPGVGVPMVLTSGRLAAERVWCDDRSAG